MDDKTWDAISGLKDDAGKQMAGLMVRDFANALGAVADVTTFGAEKYAPSNWLHVHGAKDRYADALFRHLLAWAGGEEADEESGMLHLSHAAWNIMAIIELEMRGQRCQKP